MINVFKILFMLTFLFEIQSFAASLQCNQLFKNARIQNEKIQIQLSEEILTKQKKMDKLMPDRFLMRRDWGTKLLSDFDPTWQEPAYVKMVKEFMNPQITNYGGKASLLFRDYQKLFNNFAFGEIKNIFSNGTDANNYLFLYARKNFEIQKGREPKNMKFITFSNMYGGSHGPIYDTIHGDRNYIIDRPVYTPGQELSPQDIALLEIKEEKALKQIENLIHKKQNDVTAILFEPISIVDGVSMFRTSFLEKLQEMTKEHKIPIFADEIYTGGGRTGKFWAFQHYTDKDSMTPFVPDLITFGKGLGVSGIIKTRINHYNHGALSEDVFHQGYSPTTMMNSLALVQSYQIVKTIWERRLDLNAAKVGQHYLMRMNQALETAKINALKQDEVNKKDLTGRSYTQYYESLSERSKSFGGIGLMLWYTDMFSYGNNISDVFSGDYQNRKSPILTLSEEDIDYVLSKKLNWKLSKIKE